LCVSLRSRFHSSNFLTKREGECLNAGIKEFDLESPVFYSTLLPDELIETGLSSLAGADKGGVNSAIVAGRGANFTLKRTVLPFFDGPNTICRSRAWSRNTILPGAA
jgi:hypothetical protein